MLLAGAGGATVPAGPAFAATWSVVPTPSPAPQAAFSGVDALNPHEVWAVGNGNHSPDQPFRRPFAARWNGSAWSPVAMPSLDVDASLAAVDGSGSTNVWAVGSRDVPLGGGRFTTAPLIERWNGSSWSVLPSPTPPDAIAASLSGVKAFSATDAWAVGEISRRTLILRWNGTSWSTVSSPNPDPQQNVLTSVDGVAPTDVWAVGNKGDDGYGGGTTSGLVLHWNGSAWSQVNVPAAEGDDTFRTPTLTDVFVLASNDVWIVGRAFHFPTLRTVPIALHWDGGTAWVLESTPADLRPRAATATGTATVWAVGTSPQGATMAVRTTNG